MSDPRPSVGRIVTYRSPIGERDCAAIITGLAGDGTNVLLTVFPPRTSPYPLNPAGGVRQSPAGDPVAAGTWRWPERVT